jgi:glycosyltransferase involved in cell wall biosynthesis
MEPELAVVVTARNEADRLPDTLAALSRAFPEARLVVADDASTDPTPHVALQRGAELVRAPRRLGKGGAATAAVRRVIEEMGRPPLVLLCDGDLGESAAVLTALVSAVESGDADLAVAAFARREGGGFGIALSFARTAIRRLTGLDLQAPISGQRAIKPDLVPSLLPFAPRFGMETGMTVDAHRAGGRILEIELHLEHRATGRSLRGFAHRGRQLLDFARVYLARRRASTG